MLAENRRIRKYHFWGRNAKNIFRKKSKEYKRRENILKEVYEKVAALNNDDDFIYDIEGSPRYFPNDEDSPKYYPSDDDDTFLMNENDNNN